MRNLVVALVILCTARSAIADEPSRAAVVKRAHRKEGVGLALTFIGIGLAAGGITPAVGGIVAEGEPTRTNMSALGGSLIGVGLAVGAIGTTLMILGGKAETKVGAAVGAR
jgi:hypothetical protein